MQIISDKYQPVSNATLAGEGHKRRIGYTFKKGEKVAWRGKCPICGDWISHDFANDRQKMIEEGRWDFDKKRMTHCGKNSLCRDWWQKYKEHNEKLKSMQTEELFFTLKRKGMIA